MSQRCANIQFWTIAWNAADRSQMQINDLDIYPKRCFWWLTLRNVKDDHQNLPPIFHWAWRYIQICLEFIHRVPTHMFMFPYVKCLNVYWVVQVQPPPFGNWYFENHKRYQVGWFREIYVADKTADWKFWNSEHFRTFTNQEKICKNGFFNFSGFIIPKRIAD